MNPPRLLRNPLPKLATVAAILFAFPAPTQVPREPTLNDILQHLENNLNDYDSKVPSFFCDEHVVSDVFPGNSLQNTITDSIFRLKRVPHPDHTTSLEESRTVKTVNGRPATSNDDLSGPTVLSGAFEGGLAVVSLNQRSCMSYKLSRSKTGRPAAPYIIHFSTQSHPPQPADCLLQESANGQAFIDPVTLQITRLELTTPHHTIFNIAHPLKGKWILSVDYAPIQLDTQTFWMPVTITSHVSADTDTFHPTIWSFKATYRNYHKLEVSSRILPADGPSTP